MVNFSFSDSGSSAAFVGIKNSKFFILKLLPTKFSGGLEYLISETPPNFKIEDLKLKKPPKLPKGLENYGHLE